MFASRRSTSSSDHDSDVGHINSGQKKEEKADKDLEKRREEAQKEVAWETATKADREELLIWRIEGEKAVLVEIQDHGIFFTDAIYIILKVANKQRKICYDLHFWIPYEMCQKVGPEPPKKVMELSALLNDKVIYHKEIEYFESPILLNYFKTFIVLHGSSKEAFNDKEPKTYKPRLLKFKLNTNRGEIREVPLSTRALQSRYVFILDKGSSMLQWNGSSCREKDRAGAGPHIENFLNRRKGKLMREFYDEEDLLSINPFTSVLPDEAIKPTPTPLKHTEKAMFRLSDDSGKLKLTSVYRGHIFRRGLNPSDANIIDTPEGLYIYIGPMASEGERKSAWRMADEYLESTACATRPIHYIHSGQKSYEFEEIWDDYS